MNILERVIGFSPKKVIYVDIDGVLLSEDFAKFCLEEEAYDPFDNDELDPRAIKNLKRIVDETGASIVLSSSWRWDEKAFAAVKGQLKAFGLEIGDTTIMEPIITFSRTREIVQHLEEHPSIVSYVILDDAEIKEPLIDHWVHCPFKTGLTRTLADKAIEILKEK